MSPEEMAEIRARCEAATPGPWEATCYRVVETAEPLSDGSYEGSRADVCEVLHYRAKGGADDGTAQFIAHARTDVPALLAEVERLTKVAAAERALRKAAEEYTRSGGCPGEQVCEAATALRALGVEP